MLSASTAVLLVTYLSLVFPDVSKPYTVVVPPLLIFVILYFLIRALFQAIGLSDSIQKILGILISVSVSLLLAFSAVGGLAVGDILLFVALIVLALFYIQRSWKK